MENASRALVMAGGVLFALLIIGAIFITKDMITSYQVSKIEQEEYEQIVYANNEYLTYNRTDVRGNDIISLVNKVIEDNYINSSDIKLEININNISDLSYSSTQKLIKSTSYTQDTFKTLVYNVALSIENKYGGVIVCSKLSTNISNIVDSHIEENIAMEKVNEIINTTITTSSELDAVQEDVLKYYEYTQFKRAYFDCITMDYDEYGNIANIEFESNGKFN